MGGEACGYPKIPIVVESHTDAKYERLNSYMGDKVVLEIRSNVAKQIPSSVKNALSRMPGEQQAVFEEEYVDKRRSGILLLLLSILFPIHFFFEGRVGLGILYWLTGWALGIWWVIEILTVWGRTKRYNQDTAIALLRDMKIMNSENATQNVIIDQRRMA